MAPGMTLSITAAICTRNRPDHVGRVVADLRAERAAGDRVLVVDQSDDPAATAAALAGLGCEHRVDPSRGLPAARNVALDAVDTPIVWFLDDDARVMPGALDAVRRAFDDPTVGGVTTRIEERRVALHPGPTRLRIGWDGRVRQRVTATRGGSVAFLQGASFAARTVALRAAGPCDPGFGGTAFLEDADWSTRLAALGWRLVVVPEAVVVHLAAPRDGCRAPDRRTYDRWRFHNTARWLRRHRPLGVVAAAPVFGAIALRTAWRASDPGRVVELVSAFADGWAGAALGDDSAGPTPASVRYGADQEDR